MKSVADGKPLEPSEQRSPSKTCRIVDGNYDDKQDEYDTSVSTARWAFAAGPPDLTSISSELAPYAADDSYQTHALRATLALDLGQVDAAAAEIELAQARIEMTDKDDKADRRVASWRRRLPVMFALRTGKPFAPFERDPEFSFEDDEAILLRGGARPRELTRLDGKGAEVVAAVGHAQDGDGLPLADLFERATDRTFRLDDEYLLALAPLVKTHREELARAVKNRPRSRGLHENGVERDILRMLGDSKGADRLQAIIDRGAKADKERLKAWLIAGTLY